VIFFKDVAVRHINGDSAAMRAVKDDRKAVPGRMNIRLAAEVKERVVRAAALSGQDLTEFAVVALSEKAAKVIEQHDQVVLSSADYQFFLDKLSVRSKPSQRSRSVAAKYRKGIRKGVRHHLAD